MSIAHVHNPSDHVPPKYALVCSYSHALIHTMPTELHTMQKKLKSLAQTQEQGLPTYQYHGSVFHMLQLADARVLLLLPLDRSSNDVEQLL